jgi:dCTP deaminase
MILSDTMIIEAIEKGELRFEPKVSYDSQVQPSSVDLRLGNSFRVFNYSQCSVIDPTAEPDIDEITELVELEDGHPFIVHPGAFVLGTTMEYIWLPANLVGRLEGRSSLGRLGVIVHSTAGYVDPGFEGTLTLEISNVGKIPVALYPGMRVCQITFLVTERVSRPYGSTGRSKYQGQKGATSSRLGLDAEFGKKG